MTKENKIIPLMLLQHSDSAFPSGAVSFSWGLETLVNRGIVAKADDVQAFLNAHLTARWASLDRIMLVHAHQSWNDPDHSCCGMGKDFFRPEADAPHGHFVLFQFLDDQSFSFGGFEGFCSPTVNQDRRGSNE